MKQSICKTAALYLRLSREDNLEGESYSIQNQQKLLEKAATEQGYKPVIYSDDGISGTVTDRPGYQKMIADGREDVTDDAMVVEAYGKVPVYVIDGSYRNFKITTPEDLVIAEAFLRENRE